MKPTQLTTVQKDIIERAMGNEAIGGGKGLTQRNELAYELFAKPANRFITNGSVMVETWYDRTSRNWITEVKEAKTGYRLWVDDTEVPADYTGNRFDAAVAHLWACDKWIVKTNFVTA